MILLTLFSILVHLVHLDGKAVPPSLEIYPKQPQVSLPEGESASLTCRGIGYNLTFFDNFKWFDPKGQEIDSKHELYNRNYVIKNLQSNSISLSFISPTNSLSGNYTCRTASQMVDNLSESIEVSFYQDISWEDCPSSQALIKDEKNARIRCKVSANPPAQLSWTKDGTVLKSESFISTDHGLDVNGVVDETLEGKYQVEAHVMETGKIKYRAIVVNIHTLPKIVDLNSTYEVIEGEEAELKCKATGLPHPRYYWLDSKGGNLSSTDGYIVDTKNGQLIIKKIDRNQIEGAFTCVVENSAGTDRKTTLINVLSRPEITVFTNGSSVVGQSLSLICEARGNPAPKLTIRKNGRSNPIIASDHYDIELLELNKFETKLSVKIDNVQRHDEGLYYCSASNKIGRQDKVGYLQVEYVPDLSKTPRIVKTWNDLPVNLTCVVSAIPNATVSWYFDDRLIDASDPMYRIINGELTDFKSMSSNQLLVNPKMSTSKIYGTYVCEASNKHGKKQIRIELSKANKPSFKVNPTLLDDSPTSIKIQIPPEILNDGGLPIKHIRVKFRESNENESKVRFQDFPFESEHILKSLYPRRTYFISVSAFNDVGSSEWTSVQEKKMPNESVPDCPKFLHNSSSILLNEQKCDIKPEQPVDTNFSDKFDVKWQEPNDGGRKIAFYSIKVYPVVRTLNDWNRIGDYKDLILPSPNQLTYHLTELRPNSTYEVELKAKNEEGFSNASYLIFRTSLLHDASSSREQISKIFTDFQLFLIILLIIIPILIIMLDILLFVRYDFGLLFHLKRYFLSDDHHKIEKEKNWENPNYLNNGASTENTLMMNTTQKDEFKAELENQLVQTSKNSGV